MKLTKFFVIVLIIFSASESFALPSHYDLRDYGRVTSIKNQGISGPCWAFAVLGAMESNYLTQNLGKNPDLSELHLAFYTYKNPDAKQNFTPIHNKGILSLEGNSFRAAALLMRLSGPVDEKILPYTNNISDSQKKILSSKTPESYKRSMRLRDVYFFEDNNTKKELIIKHGAIVTAFYSDIFKYHAINKFYTYYNPEHENKTNHVVLITGWDDNFSRDNFSPKPKHNGAWLIKNSWGTSRGINDGYFWMSYEQYNSGNTAFIVEKNNSRLKCYYHDDLGFCATINYFYGANIFRINTRKEALQNISFYAPYNDLDYEIYIYDLGYTFTDSPVNGRLLEVKKGNTKFAGYHTIDLPENIILNENQYFSVVMKFAGKNIPVETKINGYSDNAEINEHESYFSNDGKIWVDGKKINSNVCIKAYAIMK